MKIILLLLLSISHFCFKGMESVGVCYGRMGNNLPPAQEVIDIYKLYRISRMRIYSPEPAVLNALRGTNIELILDVPRLDIQSLGSSAQAAFSWVQNNLRSFSNVKFKYIAVGNEIKPDDADAKSVLPAMRNIHSALTAANLQDQIKVSTAIDFGLVDKSFPPDQGIFSSKAKSYVEPIVRFLSSNGSPLLANVYPYFAHVQNPTDVPLSYALFTPRSYPSLFAAQVDAIYAALEKSGGSGVRVVVSESGWPSEGGAAATRENAETYLRNLIASVSRGTPKKPGAVETYLFGMFDENRKTGAETEKHFGVFSPNKQPKYQLSFN